MTAVWDERERKTGSGLSSARRVTTRDCICFDHAKGSECTLKEDHVVGRAYGSYRLRIGATRSELRAVNNALAMGFVLLGRGIELKPGRCEHGVTFLEVSAETYAKESDDYFVGRVREEALEINKLLLLAEIQR